MAYRFTQLPDSGWAGAVADLSRPVKIRATLWWSMVSIWARRSKSLFSLLFVIRLYGELIS